MGDAELTLDNLDIVSNETFAENGYPHEAWALLRREAPVYYYDRDVKVPFWAITKHEDIAKISRQAKDNLNAPRLAVFPEFSPPEEDEREIRHLLVMDAPDHSIYRKLTSSHFTPRSVRRLEASIEQIAKETLDGIANGGSAHEIDFVTEVSAPLPLAVLAELLGVPREDWKLMFAWTNQIVGSSDPEYQKGGSAQISAAEARMQLFEYFWKMTEERRKQPRDDIASVLAHANVGGEPLPPRELLSYFFLLVVAGNETTRNAMSGGLLALIENPDQLEKLRKDPTLIDSAVEEILRWTTPVIQFCRTATREFDLRGQTIRAGDSMCLFYPSANRDEEVFDRPFEFRVDREPNRHMAFGIGEHFCLGANLARLELRILFRQLVARLQEIELIGPVERLRSSFLGGVKHIPIRHRIAPS
ncbi:MAG: cytochrome P450 [Deltaproteobacteria bacterium]|nr:cytochrome P450 [Deltaproteobacteria bacterium]MBW2725678.1 cytochrome P450 [Deltaproteobacteria bacterium]